MNYGPIKIKGLLEWNSFIYVMHDGELKLYEFMDYCICETDLIGLFL